jgi:hypothetical protein
MRMLRLCGRNKVRHRKIEHRPDGSTRGVRHISCGEGTLPRYASAWVFRRADDAGCRRVMLRKARFQRSFRDTALLAQTRLEICVSGANVKLLTNDSVSVWHTATIHTTSRTLYGLETHFMSALPSKSHLNVPPLRTSNMKRLENCSRGLSMPSPLRPDARYHPSDFLFYVESTSPLRCDHAV